MPFINTPDGVVVVDDSGSIWNFLPSDPHNPLFPNFPSPIDVLTRQGPAGGGAGVPQGFGQLPPGYFSEPVTGGSAGEGGGLIPTPGASGGYTLGPFQGSPFGGGQLASTTASSLLPLLLLIGVAVYALS